MLRSTTVDIADGAESDDNEEKVQARAEGGGVAVAPAAPAPAPTYTAPRRPGSIPRGALAPISFGPVPSLHGRHVGFDAASTEAWSSLVTNVVDDDKTVHSPPAARNAAPPPPPPPAPSMESDFAEGARVAQAGSDTDRCRRYVVCVLRACILAVVGAWRWGRAVWAEYHETRDTYDRERVVRLARYRDDGEPVPRGEWVRRVMTLGGTRLVRWGCGVLLMCLVGLLLYVADAGARIESARSVVEALTDVTRCRTALRATTDCGLVRGAAVCVRESDDSIVSFVSPTLAEPVHLTTRVAQEKAFCAKGVTRVGKRAFHVTVLHGADRTPTHLAGATALCVQLMIDIQQSPLRWGCTLAEVE